MVWGLTLTHLHPEESVVFPSHPHCEDTVRYRGLGARQPSISFMGKVDMLPGFQSGGTSESLAHHIPEHDDEIFMGMDMHMEHHNKIQQVCIDFVSVINLLLY